MNVLLRIPRRLWHALRRSPAAPAPPDSALLRDEYVQHISRIIGGWLLPGNVRAIEHATTYMPATGAVVEIGSFLGLSTNIIVYALLRAGRDQPFYTCDPFQFAGGDRPKAGYFSTGTADYREWVIESYRRAITLFSRGREPYTIEVTAARFFEAWRGREQVTDLLGRTVQLGGPISFAYIDGDHTAPGIQRDFDDVDRLLVPGGFVLLDDSAATSEYADVRALVEAIGRRGDYQTVMATPNVLLRKRGGASAARRTP